mgnify:CR=1 FL=1
MRSKAQPGRPRVGLALGAGGARGWAHLGVLRRLDELGVPIDCVAGTSAGALVGAVYLAGRLDLLEALALERDGRWLPAHGRALASVPRFPAYAYGEHLLVSGKLEAPSRLEGFDYRGYLAERGIHALLRSARVAPLPADGRPPALRLLYDARHALQGHIARLMPAPESGLLAGILIGQGHALPEDLADAFRAVGLTHLIIVSGYNFAIVVQTAQQALRRVVHRWIALWSGLGAVIAYAALVGVSPPVARAAIMGALVIGAALLGRSAHPLTSLAAATWVMSAANPRVLWSVSFQLSFAATLGLLVANALFDALNVLTFFGAMSTTTVAIAVLTHYLAPILVALLNPLPVSAPAMRLCEIALLQFLLAGGAFAVSAFILFKRMSAGRHERLEDFFRRILRGRGAHE